MGMIQCRRGAVKILNRNQLKAYACECYQAIQSFTAKDGSLSPQGKHKA
jgi:hypothetical protein